MPAEVNPEFWDMIREEVDKYWFRLPDFRNRTIHITTWEPWVEHEQNLPPPLVAAVPNEDLTEYIAMHPVERVDYAILNEITGYWIPSKGYFDWCLTKAPNVESLQQWIRTGDIVNTLEHALKLIFPVHIKPQELGITTALLTYGHSNSVFVSAPLRKGDCVDKATLARSAAPDRRNPRIVGFSRFDMQVWAEICAAYPPLGYTQDPLEIPAIYCGLFEKGQPIPRKHYDLSVFQGPDDVVHLDPQYPPIPWHFWLDIEIEGQTRMIDTTEKLVVDTDPSYQYLRSFFPQMQFTCATCEIKDNKVLATNPSD